MLADQKPLEGPLFIQQPVCGALPGLRPAVRSDLPLNFPWIYQSVNFRFSIIVESVIPMSICVETLVLNYTLSRLCWPNQCPMCQDNAIVTLETQFNFNERSNIKNVIWGGIKKESVSFVHNFFKMKLSGGYQDDKMPVSYTLKEAKIQLVIRLVAFRGFCWINIWTLVLLPSYES